MSRNSARPDIESSTGGKSHPDGHSLALVKRRLGWELRTPSQNGEKREIDAFHSSSSVIFFPGSEHAKLSNEIIGLLLRTKV
jgi:hypothetical protein